MGTKLQEEEDRGRPVTGSGHAAPAARIRSSSGSGVKILGLERSEGSHSSCRRRPDGRLARERLPSRRVAPAACQCPVGRGFHSCLREDSAWLARRGFVSFLGCFIRLSVTTRSACHSKIPGVSWRAMVAGGIWLGAKHCRRRGTRTHPESERDRWQRRRSRTTGCQARTEHARCRDAERSMVYVTSFWNHRPLRIGSGVGQQEYSRSQGLIESGGPAVPISGDRAGGRPRANWYRPSAGCLPGSRC